MYQSPAANQRMKIGVSLRQALFWSLAAHVLLFVWTRNQPSFEGYEPAQLIAATISAQPPRTSPLTLPAPPLPAIVVAKSAEVGPPTAGLRHKDVENPNHVEPGTAAKVLSDALLPNRVSAPDAEGLRGYRLALAREARRSWRYPQQALDSKWQGTTDIRIELLSGGRLLSVRVEKTSGYEVLDEAALQMISSAAASAQVPASIISDSLSIVVPVKFNLAGENQSREN